MAIASPPFPNHATARGNIGTTTEAQLLFNVCGEDWIRKHVPEMVCIKDHYNPSEMWTFPTGFGIAKVRPLLVRVWPEIPDYAKKAFLAGQLNAGVRYVRKCLEAFEHTGFPIQQETAAKARRAVSWLETLSGDCLEDALASVPKTGEQAPSSDV